MLDPPRVCAIAVLIGWLKWKTLNNSLAELELKLFFTINEKIFNLFSSKQAYKWVSV